MLQVKQIIVSPLARGQILAGQVDSRLMIAIADLAADQPIGIIQFGGRLRLGQS